MRFVKGGPDIPDDLLRRHEDGEVVFFCGAGLSYPAGLPLFEGLVSRAYTLCGRIQSDVERAAFDAKRFDLCLGLLESALTDRTLMRRMVAQILEPLRKDTAHLAGHRAVATLATNRQGVVRLITTNFDRLFEEVLKPDVRRC